MSIAAMERLFQSLSPSVVAGMGGVILAGLPFAKAAPLAVLQGANVLTFALNCLAVSVPGRIDGQQDEQMRNTAIGKSTATTESTPLRNSAYEGTYSPSRGRTLVAPSGWAFAIWGPIYLGEFVFVTASCFGAIDTAVLSAISAPFCAANLFQTLWCVSFRPSYTGWTSYISPCMLAGTAYSLSQVVLEGSGAGWWLLPMTIHFGWTSAATLVNLSGSVAMDSTNTKRSITAVGHGSAVLATCLGVGLTVMQSVPAYGLTLSWALAACADGMKKRKAGMEDSDELLAAVSVQEKLCWLGAAACAAASTFVLVS